MAVLYNLLSSCKLGAMWDVGDEFLYFSVDAEGGAETCGPTFLHGSTRAVNNAKPAALESFGAEFVKGMRGLKAAVGE